MESKISFDCGANMRKCAVIGCGNVGATTAYTLMQTGWFSEMVLIDVNQKKAKGEAADIAHSLPFHSPMDIYAGDYSNLGDCGLIIITAGANQKPGETRLDLLRTNTRIFRSIVNNSYFLSLGFSPCFEMMSKFMIGDYNVFIYEICVINIVNKPIEDSFIAYRKKRFWEIFS